MMLSHPNQPQRLRGAESGSDEQAGVQRTQIEASVKSVGKCGQVADRKRPAAPPLLSRQTQRQ
jgi:hypothetical protein